VDRAQRPGMRGPSLARALLDLLFPPRCVACHCAGEWLCTTCLDQIGFYEPPWPRILEDGFPLHGVRAAAHFHGPLREAIHAFKYGGLRTLTGTLGEMLVDCWDADPWPVDVIVPVPLHPSRVRERGYNQSALLAHHLARYAGLALTEDALVRVTPTAPQVRLNTAQRVENVRDAFRCRDGSLRGSRVLLVDDVLTTGATLRACAGTALAGGASQVWGLALAHG
jgi:ComF family protein